MKSIFNTIWPVVSALLLAVSSRAAAQGTAFTYQGRLDANGVAANGTYDLQFGLWNTAIGASQVAAPLTNLDIPVVAGLFTVTLDFGASFPGAERWLEIAVRTNGGGSSARWRPVSALLPVPTRSRQAR